MRGRHTARSRLGDKEARLDRKKRLEGRHAANGIPNGLVEVPGPLLPATDEEIRNIAGNILVRERSRDEHAAIHDVFEFARGLAFETSSEKLAQHIADALARSHHANVIRTFDDEGQRRILTCHLPASRKGE